ncbi:hypothetical protein ACN2CC_35515 (plasmid) [Mesorhizobium muleiense]|uniref:hypothetical protein n=1 Tax=Mesorhizobium muleiense TaxID=1004279 RepID=UPI003AFA2146
MMITSPTIFDTIESGSFTADEAMEIDAKLSLVQVQDIPEHQVKSMMDYIDFRFLHNAVVPAIKADLENLQNAASRLRLSP